MWTAIAALVCLAVGFGLGRWTKTSKVASDQAQAVLEARQSLQAHPHSEPTDPRHGRPSQGQYH